MTEWPRVPYVGVGCVLIRNGRILLVRRHGAHGTGSWSTPGGHLEFGETPAACAAREVEEETGVRVANVEFIAITNDVFTEADKHYVTVWMRGEPDATEATIRAPEEIADVGWFHPATLPTPLFQSFASLIDGHGMPALSAGISTELAAGRWPWVR